MQQLHNARYQSGEAIIRYRFHPHYEEGVIVAGRNRHGDEVALIIRQPDGTLVQLPIWMTEDRAEAMMVTESPRLPLTNLRELRLKLDDCLSLLRDDSCCEGGDKHEASSILSPPTRSLRGQDSTGTDSTGRADEAVASALLSEARGAAAATEAGDEDHLARGAFIYIRQSTVDQLANNHESRRRQYGLAERARALGWTDVTVIGDDLGRSGLGVSRPGFEKLLSAMCEGRVGAVFAIEVSRLPRNGCDWHTLIEFCGLVGAVIVDEDGLYDLSC